MEINIGSYRLGKGHPLLVIAGPCVIEPDTNITYQTAERLKEISEKLHIQLIFKSSYDKANRTSISSYRGPGLEQGLEILKKVKADFDVPVLTDFHSVEEIQPVAAVVDVMQLPAFLSRQTDLVVEAAKTMVPLNIKKGQFLAPKDVYPLVEKARTTGNTNIFITERGNSFGYNNLVVDMRVFPIVHEAGIPIIFDATHSVQLPGGAGNASSGQRQYALTLAKAALAAGADGLFLETHPNPEAAFSDGPNMIYLDVLYDFLAECQDIYNLVHTQPVS